MVDDKNNSGPKFEPCRTPESAVNSLENILYYWIMNVISTFMWSVTTLNFYTVSKFIFITSNRYLWKSFVRYIGIFEIFIKYYIYGSNHLSGILKLL